MTPREADKIIKAGKPVTVNALSWDGRIIETFTATFVSRDRFCIATDNGGKFDRPSLQLVR